MNISDESFRQCTGRLNNSKRSEMRATVAASRKPKGSQLHKVISMGSVYAGNSSSSSVLSQSHRGTPIPAPVELTNETGPMPEPMSTSTPTISTQGTTHYDDSIEQSHWISMMHAWKKLHRYRSIPCPSATPKYLREPLEMGWVDTNTNRLRREYNIHKYRSGDQPEVRRAGSTKKRDSRSPPKKKQPFVRTNRTNQLRKAFINREPVLSTYFEIHYQRHRKPPFRGYLAFPG